MGRESGGGSVVVGPATSYCTELSLPGGKVRGDDDDDDGRACGWWVDAAEKHSRPSAQQFLTRLLVHATEHLQLIVALARSQSKRYVLYGPGQVCRRGGVLKYLLTSPKLCQPASILTSCLPCH